MPVYKIDSENIRIWMDTTISLWFNLVKYFPIQMIFPIQMNWSHFSTKVESMMIQANWVMAVFLWFMIGGHILGIQSNANMRIS